MIAPKRRLTNYALHGREEWFGASSATRSQAAGILEVVLSGIVLAALLMSIVPLVEHPDLSMATALHLSGMRWTSSSAKSRCWRHSPGSVPGAALRHCPADRQP